MDRAPKATEALIVLARVRAGEGDDARAAIAALGGGDQGPFAHLAHTHVARLQVLRVPARRRWLRRPIAPREHLLLAVDVDAPAQRWIATLCATMAPGLDAVLAHCAFYPGVANQPAFAAWIGANRIKAGFSVIGSPEATVAQVGQALRVHEEVAGFAQATQSLPDDELHEAWKTWCER